MNHRSLFFLLSAIGLLGSSLALSMNPIERRFASLCAHEAGQIRGDFESWASQGEGMTGAVLARFANARHSNDLPVIFPSGLLEDMPSYVGTDVKTISILWEFNGQFRLEGTRIGVRWDDRYFWNWRKPNVTKPIYELVYALPSNFEAEPVTSNPAQAFTLFSQATQIERPIEFADHKAAVLDLLVDPLTPPNALIVWRANSLASKPEPMRALLPIPFLASGGPTIVIVKDLLRAPR